ncbi:hypothetical protein H2O64_18415 [Kordia sp. YSTF-M3]|uniref:Uncharacterized protein n=1 Tax=Kordia aestuariivivens TaxID=2759037 RepID=A0ABR7QDZ9_9FLAO|nr:hypothetical protein [Kordia aestuariivivens]MBC8756653.1 hypothetical protein [Kordia aestuariivivens]
MEQDLYNTTINHYGYLALLLVFSTLNLIYHYKSYCYYRERKPIQVQKKISKIYWLGVLCFNGVLFYSTISYLYSYVKFTEYDYFDFDTTYLLWYALQFFIFGSIGFLEFFLLRKRIKELRIEANRTDEIKSIGNSSI